MGRPDRGACERPPTACPPRILRGASVPKTDEEYDHAQRIRGHPLRRRARRRVARQIRRRRRTPGARNARPRTRMGPEEGRAGARCSPRRRRQRNAEAGAAGPSRDLADEFVAVGLAARPRKKSTVVDYTATLRNHLRPVFDNHDLGQAVPIPRTVRAVRRRQDRRRTVTEDRKKPPRPRGTRCSRPRGAGVWVSENPLDLVDKPSTGDADTETMDATAVTDLLAAYRVLET